MHSAMSSDKVLHRPSARWIHILPFLVVLSVVLFELETTSLRVTPSLLTIAVAVFALFLRPQVVLMWSLGLLFPVMLTLVYVPSNGVYESNSMILLRVTAYVAVAVLAFGYSRRRNDAERQLGSLLAIFDALETPIIVSDADGIIAFVNRACCQLLGQTENELKDTNFFSVFAQPDVRGKAIDNYLKMFELSPGQTASSKVTVTQVGREKTLSTKCSLLQLEKSKLLVTQLD